MKLTLKSKRSIKALLVCVYCAFVFCANSQSLLNRTYLEGRPIMVFSSVIQNSDGYNVIGGTYGSVPNEGKVWLSQVGQNGDVVLSKIPDDSIPVTFGVLTNAFIKDSNARYAFTGFTYDSVANLLFGTADTLLDSIHVFSYYTPNTLAYNGYSVTNYGTNFYVTGIRTELSSNNGNLFLTKIDSSGNRLWEMFYNQKKSDIGESIIKLRNGRLLIGASRNDKSNNNEHANTWLLEVDTGGIMQRQWFDNNDSTYAAKGLLQTADGGFVYAAQKKLLQYAINTIAYTATVVKLDSNFSKQWTFTGGDLSVHTAITDIEQLPDGSFVACGTKPDYYTDTNMLSGWVIKLSANGQLIWDRVYRGIPRDETLNFLTDIDVLPDGGFIAVGQCQDVGNSPSQVGWFLKLDSNGCEIENCTVGIETPKSPKGDFNSQIQIYPNPFTSDISIALTGEHVSTATYTITTLTGQTVYRQTESNLATGYTKMLDLSYLPNGVYCVEVSTGEGNVVQRVVKQ